MKKLICILFFLPFFLNCHTAFAAENKTEYLIDKNEIESSLTEDAKKISGEIKLNGTYDIKAAFKRLFDYSTELFERKIKNELGFGLELVALAVLCSVVNCFCKDKSILTYMNILSCTAAAIMISGSVDSLIRQASETMQKLSDYSKAAMPAIFSAAAACGAPASSAAKYAAASLSIDVLISLAVKYIVPLVKLYITAAISRSIFDNSILTAIIKFIKWLITTSMTVTTMAFTAYISFTGLISGTVDAAAVKTTRTIIANGLPVVGKLISDASSVILAGANMVKNSAGVYCLIAVCALCASPFLDLMVKMLVFKASAAACDMLPGAKLSGLINDLGTAFSMLLGLVGCCGIMLFISIIAGIKVIV